MARTLNLPNGGLRSPIPLGVFAAGEGIAGLMQSVQQFRLRIKLEENGSPEVEKSAPLELARTTRSRLEAL